MVDSLASRQAFVVIKLINFGSSVSRCNTAFLQKIQREFPGVSQVDQVPMARRLAALQPEAVLEAVASHDHVSVDSYCQRRSTARGRDLAAYLAHRRTTATRRELAAGFGLSHPDSVSTLIRRAERALTASRSPADDLATIEQQLRNAAV